MLVLLSDCFGCTDSGSVYFSVSLALYSQHGCVFVACEVHKVWGCMHADPALMRFRPSSVACAAILRALSTRLSRNDMGSAYKCFQSICSETAREVGRPSAEYAFPSVLFCECLTRHDLGESRCHDCRHTNAHRLSEVFCSVILQGQATVPAPSL